MSLKSLTIPIILAAMTTAAPAPCGPSGDDDTSTPLTYTWYYTCGDPVCRGYTPSGAPLCTTEQEGDPCGKNGATCDPKDECNRLMVCSDTDPTSQGCPISQRSKKYDIRYLDSTSRHALYGDLLETRLATYHYRGEASSAPTRLGFIIDDQPQSPAVLPGGERVDLYGYTSMTVAAVQVQAEELKALKAEVASLKKALEQKQCKE